MAVEKVLWYDLFISGIQTRIELRLNKITILRIVDGILEPVAKVGIRFIS